MQGIFKLEGKVQHYSWGGYDYIPQLLNQNNTEGKPFAEYWMGAHSSQPSMILHGTMKKSLPAILSQEASTVLGNKVSHLFGSLPYLLKVLDVRQMLSIQVHPSKEEAAKGYKREEEAGIPLTAPHRNYKDENHKPELMVALGPFWLLHGFKPEEQLKEVLQDTSELKPLEPIFQNKGYKGLYEYVMTLPQEEVDDLLTPLAKRVLPLYEAERLEKSAEDFWAARAIQTFCNNDHYDRGIFSIYFFNLLQMNRGEGIFQPAGMPHAYLEGQNVEIMANSDNVLRAGLTEKHIDVPELLKHTNFTATIPNIITPKKAATFYEAPVPEFGLYQYELEKGAQTAITPESAEIYIILEGAVDIQAGNASLSLRQGEAAIAYANTQLSVTSLITTNLFRATVGRI